MKTTSRLLPLSTLLVALLAVPALVLRVSSSRAESPPGTAPPAASALAASSAAGSAASASGSASASASGSGSARAALPPRISENPPGEEKSKTPTVAEWKKSERVTLDGQLATDCEVRRVREWVRITCQDPAASVSLIGGPYEGFAAALSPWKHEPIMGDNDMQIGVSLKGGYSFQFPVRRGERRVYEVMIAEFAGYQGVLPSLDYYAIVAWPEGEEPTILIQRP